jgi:DNA-binding transcriptional LysR family regulator
MYQPVQLQQSWGPNFINPSLMLQAVKQGQGIALSSLILAANDIEKSALVCSVNKEIKSRYGYYIVHKHEGLDSPQLGIFINWLTTQTKEFHDTVSLNWNQVWTKIEPFYDEQAAILSAPKTTCRT